MIIDLLKLKSEQIFINDSLKIDKDLIKSAKMLDLIDIKIKGSIRYLDEDNFKLNLFINGIMVLPCSRTLKPVNSNFSIQIEDDLLSILSEMNENIKKIGNTIDIFPIIWENILMEIPIKVISDKEIMIKEGNGWKLIEEDNKKNIINPEFEKLKDLL